MTNTLQFYDNALPFHPSLTPMRHKVLMVVTSLFSLPEDCARQLRDIYDYWVSISPAGGLPARKDLDPLDIPKLLPFIYMLDVHYDPLRYKVRLVGTGIIRKTGRESTGEWFDKVVPNFERSKAKTHLDTCVERAAPVFRRDEFQLDATNKKVIAERLYLPFANDSKTPDMLLNYAHYTDMPGKTDGCRTA